MTIAEARATSVRRAAGLRGPAVRGLHLFALSGFALAQPLLDILGKNAEFFAVRGSTPREIVVFALAVTFVPAAFLLAVELVAGTASAAAGVALHLLFVAVLAGIVAVQVLERLGLAGTAPLLVAAALAGAAAAVALVRVRHVRTFVTVLSAAPLVFLAAFLFASHVTPLVFPGDVEVALANVDSRAPVVMVVFDELPVTSLMDEDGGIDALRYPNFARLARDSTWFRNATTLSGSTTQAVPALLTGKRPQRGRLPVFQNHPNNLFTLLGGAYRMNVVESQTRLCPPELCEREDAGTRRRLSSLIADARLVYLHVVAPPALAERLPAIDDAWTNFGDETADLDAETEAPDVDVRTFYVGRVDEFNDFASSIGGERRGRPSLNFLHVLLPHGPWLHFPSGRMSAVANPRARGRAGETWVDEGLALQAFQRHLLQLGYTDRLLGELLDRLEEAGLYGRSLVVVTADHGISFRAGDKRRAPTEANFAELAFVPFFVKSPGERRGRVVERHVTIADVLPTMADALGTTLPWQVDGRSGLAAGEGEEEVRVGRMAVPFSEALERRDEALARQVRLFGSGHWKIFGVGPYARLLDRPLDGLAVGEAAAAEAEVDRVGSELLRSLDPGSPLVPSPLAGTLVGTVAAGDWLAFALDGRVAALCRAYQGRDGTMRFSALVPETAFRGGEHEVRAFLVSGAPDAPKLRELAVRPSD